MPELLGTSPQDGGWDDGPQGATSTGSGLSGGLDDAVQCSTHSSWQQPGSSSSGNVSRPGQRLGGASGPCQAAASMQLHRSCSLHFHALCGALRLSDTGMVGVWHRGAYLLWPRRPCLACLRHILICCCQPSRPTQHVPMQTNSADGWKAQVHRLQSEAGAGTAAAAAPAHSSAAGSGWQVEKF